MDTALAASHKFDILSLHFLSAQTMLNFPQELFFSSQVIYAA